MKKSIILELAFGDESYAEKIKLETNEEYNKNNEELYGLCEELCKDMPEEEKRKVIDKIFFAQCGAESIAADEHFKAGFKLGLILGAQNFLE